MTDDLSSSYAHGVEGGQEPPPGGVRAQSAPYMAGRAFTNMFDKYGADGLPDVFDISFFGNISGSTIAQIRSTMRYFDLIDDDYVPTGRMRELVAAEEETRKSILRTIVEEKYADALALSQNATSGQLAKVFAERGITGATVDKAIAFYLHLLDYLGFPYSANFKKRRPSNGGSRRRKQIPKSEGSTPNVPPPPPQKITTEQEQKAKYVEMLMQLAAKDDAAVDLQKDLLDRIEKALGIGKADPRDDPVSTDREGNN